MVTMGMRRLELAFAGALVFLMTFAGVSLAATAVDPPNGAGDTLQAVYNAFAGGHYAYAAAIGLVVAVALARKYLGGALPWMHTDAGAAGLVLLGSFGTALAASLAGGGTFTLPVAESAGAIAVAAAGGYAALKKLVIVPLAPYLPHWLQAPVLWLFNHASDPNPTPIAQRPAPSAFQRLMHRIRK